MLASNAMFPLLSNSLVLVIKFESRVQLNIEHFGERITQQDVVSILSTGHLIA